MRRVVARVLAGLTAVTIVAALVVTRFTLHDDDSPTTTTASDEFTIEGDEGSLTFGRDDQEATVEFEGDEGEGRFSFDLDGDGVVTQGVDGTFELTDALPPGWPPDFPVPLGALVERGSIVSAGPLLQRSATYTLDQPVAEALSWYESLLTEAGLETVVGAGQAQAGAASTISFEGRWTGFVTLIATDTGSELGIQLFEEEPASD